ncbi:MAG: hypothetical protein COB15_06695 [Flavobacteriales bacterium]|nr:MAG: hypothetical protein COB15_06695 [Flavobacteriales bacterium]
MKFTKLILLAFASAFFLGVNAQTEKSSTWCVTMEQTEELYKKNPALIQQDLDVKQQITDYINNTSGVAKKASPWIIPVVVHNITHNGGQGYVSKADIEAQLVTLNEDFKRLNADASSTRAIFSPFAAATDVEFRLAHIDPNGDCTEGIVRIEDPLSNFPVPRNDVKAVSYWNSKKYFNIWVIDNIESTSGGYVAGYAQFPTSGINSTYGVVMKANQVQGGDRTLTHEVGHCFGLSHTFEGGCGNNCSNSGDRVCDTPPVTASTQGCNTSQNSCSNDTNGPDPWSGSNVVDQIENYMSYDNCQNMFTLGQRDVMEYYLNSTSSSMGLAQLSNSSNLSATGVANPYNPVTCIPVADFSFDKEYICEGGIVNFTDDSYNATPTGYNWIFTGGTPSTSGSANPAITYNTAGVYSVVHQPSTTAGSDTEVKTSIITVSSLTADYIGPIIEGFENTTQFGNDWIINNDGGFTWENNSSASTTGSRSVRIRNWFTNTDGLVDELISPSFDISTTTTKTMTFKQAFAKKTSTNTDKMFVYYSTDCGSSWALKLPLTQTILATAPDQGSMFTPSTSDWVLRTIDLTAIGSSTNVRFKFKFTSGGGNDIYLDDINIGGSTGINDFSSIGSFNVFPNPTNSSAQISFNLVKGVNKLSIKVRNAIGQEVTRVIDGQSFSQGKYTLKIDEERKLSAGIYFIEFNADNTIQTQKLIIQ